MHRSATENPRFNRVDAIVCRTLVGFVTVTANHAMRLCHDLLFAPVTLFTLMRKKVGSLEEF